MIYQNIMKPIKIKTYQSLRYRIITHDLKPGVQLNEHRLMDEYNIGRTPLREVFIELYRDGLIQRFPRSGTFVAPLDFHFFRQVVEIRASLEPYAAQLAASRVTEGQLSSLRGILEKVESDSHANEKKQRLLTQYEFDFHDILYEATHNQKLIDILHELHGISARFWHYLVFSQQELAEQFDDLNVLYRALEKREPDKARTAMEVHIHNFINKVREMVI
jgi:DNA-binding GntR family transcriptional regulator